MSHISDELLLTELKLYLRRDVDTLLSQRNELQASVINLTTQRDALIYEITSKVLNEDVLNRLSSHVAKSEPCLFDTDLELSSPLIKTEPYSFVIESEPSSSVSESEPSSSVSELEPLLPVVEHPLLITDLEPPLLITDLEPPLLITDSNQEELDHVISSENSSVDKEQVTYKFLEDVYELNDIIEKEKKPVPSSPTEIDKFLNDIYGLDEIVEKENDELTTLERKKGMTDLTSKVANLLHVNPVENIDTFLEVAYELNEEKQNDGSDEPIHYTKHHSTHHQKPHAKHSKHHDRHNDK